jgi:hypothetical protein
LGLIEAVAPFLEVQIQDLADMAVDPRDRALVALDSLGHGGGAAGDLQQIQHRDPFQQ